PRPKTRARHAAPRSASLRSVLQWLRTAPHRLPGVIGFRLSRSSAVYPAAQLDNPGQRAPPAPPNAPSSRQLRRLSPPRHVKAPLDLRAQLVRAIGEGVEDAIDDPLDDRTTFEILTSKRVAHLVAEPPDRSRGSLERSPHALDGGLVHRVSDALGFRLD